MVAVISAWLAQAGPATIASPGLGGGKPFVFPVERMAFGLLLCILLAWGAALLIRRYRQSAGTSHGRGLAFLPKVAARRLRVIESRRTGGTSEVCLIACDGREYLVAITAGHALLLRESEVVPATEDAALLGASDEAL